MLKKFLHNQRGQMFVLYALLVPILFLVGGAAVDLGWYYVNAARLQNMADSAIIASSKVLTKTDGELSNYRYNYYLPQAPKQLTAEEYRNTESGDLEAKKYISKNLEISNDWIADNHVTDTFSDVTLNFKKNTFPTKDADGYPILYYEITLSETPNHLFEFFNFFGETKISVKSAAKFTQVPDSEEETGPSLFDQMEAIKKDKVYDYWEVIQNEYREDANKLKADIKAEAATTGEDEETVRARYIAQLAEEYMERGVAKDTAISRATNDLKGDRSADKARERSVTTSGNYWLKDSTSYRTENLTLRGIGGNKFDINQTSFDDLFINTIQDLNFNFKADWDITETLPAGFKVPDSFLQTNCGIWDGDTKITAPKNNNPPLVQLLQKADPDNLRFFYRVLALIGVEEDRSKIGKKIFPYKVREGRDKPDPLYARIESEPIKWEQYYTSYTSWNSVRQFFIDVNCANTKDEDRPIIFFYDGPRKINEDSHIRDSKPIIFNLNADFRGVIYAPNSPVVVAGNNHNFTGFIVAKKFLKLKTDSDFTEYKKVVRKDNHNDVYVAEENIKSSETLPENSIAVTYSEGESGKNYYIERDAKRFEKISQVKVDSTYYSPVKIPEMFVNEIGDVQFSDEISATVEGTDETKYTHAKDNIFTKDDFNLASSTFNNFFIVKFVNYTYLNREGSLDNFFATERSKNVY